MHCPICKSHLRIIEAAHLELDQCPTCHGVWFDQHELRPFIEFVLQNRDDVDDAHYDPLKGQYSVPGAEEPVYPCPVCAVDMVKFNYAVDSNVILDRCPECEGLWVEKPEVRDLASFILGEPIADKVVSAQAGMAASSADLKSTVEATVKNIHSLALALGGVGPRKW